MTSWARSRARSFVIARLTWVLAVVGLMTMWAAISSLDSPCATRVTTSPVWTTRIDAVGMIPRGVPATAGTWVRIAVNYLVASVAYLSACRRRNKPS